MSPPFKTYRVVSFDGALNAVTAELIDAANDEEAIVIARARGFGDKCEIWHGNRLVAQLEGERRQA